MASFDEFTTSRKTAQADGRAAARFADGTSIQITIRAFKGRGTVMRIAPILTIVVLAAGAAGGYAYWVQQQALRVPLGLARANGRVEVERVDVATKNAGRIAELRVNEGAAIEKDDILARIDTTE